LTFAKFHRSIATLSCVLIELICAMILCASACLPDTVPGSAVAAVADSSAAVSAQTHPVM